MKLKHKCAKKHGNFHLTSQWIAQHYLEDFRCDPTWKITSIIARVKKEMKLRISKIKAWRVRDYTLKQINGDEKEQYSRLYDYRRELLRTNPGSTVEFKEEKGVFEGMYVCLAGLKMAFKSGCRPMVYLDGCWLKGTFGGQLLAATTIDPNDCILPIAWAAVNTKSTDTWSWFFQLLQQDLEMWNSYHWVFMSDRQKVNN